MPQSQATTKIVLSAVFILAIIAFVLWQTMSGSAPVTAIPEGTTSAPSETTNPNAGTPQASGGTPDPTPVGSGTAAVYKDGSYTGKATDAFYGIVQVKAVVKGGKLADVVILQAPNDPGHTTEVTNQSMPILVQEAIQIQGAQVDIVSGATQTSEGFQTSLSSALLQAKA
jgi:uncharacterized protein with FMN-binding domain